MRKWVSASVICLVLITPSFGLAKAVNHLPVANNDAARVNGASMDNVIDVLANDTDEDRDTLTVISVSPPINGTAVMGVRATNILYTPNVNFSGTEIFTYTVSDGKGGTDTAIVTVTVLNDSPRIITFEEPSSQKQQLLPDCRYTSKSLVLNSPLVNQKRIFPNGDLFRPLLADPKQPQFVASGQRVEPRGTRDAFRAGWVAFGENFGIYRSIGSRACDGWQLNILAGVFAQFDLTMSSNDLVNADYIIGFPTTFRQGDFSGRLRLYHQSSHLGDEFILGNQAIENINLSFEELELLLSHEWFFFRIYFGGGFLVRRSPDLDRLRWQYGGEIRLPISEMITTRFVPYPIYLVAGSDIKQFQQHEYALDFSAKAGFELASNLTDRRFRILLTYYKGFNPFGQFFDQELKATGFEFNFGF